jgi:nitroreductase
MDPTPVIGDPSTIAAMDHVLSTTRSVRHRLDLTRDVDDATILACIDVAEQAPTGGNLSSRRWMVVRDRATRAGLAELYRAAGGDGLIRLAERLKGTGHPSERVMTSGGYLAEHLQDVPVIVIACIWGTHDGSGRPGLFDSVLQSAWSFCLAARARGLGTAWTTVHLGRADAVADLLGIPDGVTQVVLLPLAHTVGTAFRPAARRPATEITYFDRWGYTRNRPSIDGLPHIGDELGVVAEIDVAASPTTVWALVSDITTPARVGSELQSAEWIDPGPAVGARFRGRNALEGLGTWSTTCTVMVCDPPGNGRVAEFTWHVVDPDAPAARWSFQIEPIGRHVRLRQRVIVAEHGSGTAAMVHNRPEREQAILDRRLAQLKATMQRTVEGIKALAEAGRAEPS